VAGAEVAKTESFLLPPPSHASYIACYLQTREQPNNSDERVQTMNLLGNWFTKRPATRQHRSSRLRMKQPEARQARRFRPSLEVLEDRLAPTANIAITNALVVDGNAQPLSVVSAGQSVFIEADFTTQDLPSNASYRVSFTVNGQNLVSSYVNWGAGPGTGYWYLYWGTFLAAQGTNQVTVTIDPDQNMQQTSYADRTMSFTFNTAPPPLALTPWTGLGGAALSISSALDANGNLDEYAIGTNKAVYYQSQASDGTWSGWIGLGGDVLSISAIRDSGGDMDVFAIGANKAVYYRSQTPTGAWSGWIRLGGTVLSTSTSLDAKGDMDVMAIGTNHAVYYQSQASNGAWSGWRLLGGDVLSVSAGRDRNGNLDVFAIGTNHAVYYQSQLSTGAWSGWIGLGGWVQSLTTAVDGNGDLDVFAIGGGQVPYYRSQLPNGQWTHWTSLGGAVLSLSATLDANGDLVLFGIGTDQAVYYQVLPANGAWSGWVGLGGGVLSISATCDNHGNPEVFAIGTDQAVYYADDALYSPASGTLFNSQTNQPSYLDVAQGDLADCWLLAGLAEVAARAPQDIVNMFTYDGTQVDNGSVVDVYTVRFFNSSGVAQYVSVDTELPDSGGAFDHPVNGVLWVALAEKAYAEANAAGIVSTNVVGANDYNALNYGYPSWVLQAVTGRPASSFNIDLTNIAAAWTAGDLICICTSTPTSPYIVGGHCYAVVGYDASSSTPFEVLNPWGGTTSSVWCTQDNQVYGLFSADATFLSQNFTWESQGSGQARGQFGIELSAAPGAVGQADQVASGNQTVNSQLNQIQGDCLFAMLTQRTTDFDGWTAKDHRASVLALRAPTSALEAVFADLSFTELS
jgi:hypothetical protein